MQVEEKEVLDMLTDDQVEAAAAETMVPPAAIRAAAATLCGPRDAHKPADVVAVTIRLLMQRTPAKAPSDRRDPRRAVAVPER